MFHTNCFTKGNNHSETADGLVFGTTVNCARCITERTNATEHVHLYNTHSTHDESPALSHHQVEGGRL